MEAINDLISKVSLELSAKLDDILIEGLKRKGFEFTNKAEMVDFIKNNVRCEDNVNLKQRKYFVCDKPFFLHYYEIDYTPQIFDNPYKFIANYGKYDYL